MDHKTEEADQSIGNPDMFHFFHCLTGNAKGTITCHCCECGDKSEMLTNKKGNSYLPEGWNWLCESKYRPSQKEPLCPKCCPEFADNPRFIKAKKDKEDLCGFCL